MHVSRRAAAAVLAIVMLGEAHSQPFAPANGLIGAGLTQAERSDLFTFFRLQEVQRQQDEQRRTVVVFKPSGDSFRRFVTLRATLGANDETIVQMDLQLARSFIDEAGTRVFANDIAASFLRSAFGRGDLDRIRDLVAEISRRQAPGTTRIELRPAPQAPATESPGYLTYIGKNDRHVQKMATSALTMRAIQQQGSAWLEVRVQRNSP